MLSVNLDRHRHRRRSRLRRDLVHPTIAGGSGEIIETNSGTVDVRSGPAAIELGLAAPAPPAAGWYRLYWLEHPSAPRPNPNRVLLSASPILEPPVVLTEIRSRLREALRRNEWELRFNRAGALSPPQREQLRRRARARVRARVIGLGAAALVSSLFLVAAVLGPRGGLSGMRDDLVGGLIAAGLGLAAAGLTVGGLVRRPTTVLAARRPPALQAASGPVSVALADADNDLWAVTVVDGPRFSVAADVARAFRTPARYTVYYVPDVLLAAEPAAGGTVDRRRSGPTRTRSPPMLPDGSPRGSARESWAGRSVGAQPLCWFPSSSSWWR